MKDFLEVLGCYAVAAMLTAMIMTPAVLACGFFYLLAHADTITFNTVTAVFIVFVIAALVTLGTVCYVKKRKIVAGKA